MLLLREIRQDIKQVADKLDRQIQKHKQKLQDHHRGHKPSQTAAE